MYSFNFELSRIDIKPNVRMKRRT